MESEFKKKLEIFRGFELEDVLEFMSLKEAERIRESMKTQHLNKHLLQKHFGNCNYTKSVSEVIKSSDTKYRITEIILNSKLVTEKFNLRNYSGIKGDWDSGPFGRFHTTLDDYKLDYGHVTCEYVYLYIEIKGEEDPETEFEKRIEHLYSVDNMPITCQVRDACVIIYLDQIRDYDIW